MSAPVTHTLESLTVGDVIATATYAVDRGNLVRYAGASGDFNAIHYRDDIAEAVGLPGVLAHGMLTMGLSVQPVVDWIDDPGRVRDYQVKFTRPIVVELAGPSTIEVSAAIGAIDPDAQTARVDLTVTHAEVTVLGKAQVQITFA